MEIAEARNGVFVDKYSLNDDSGGHGKWRGGKGVCIEYRMRSDNAWLTFSYTRSKFPPWGLAGGQEGTPNYIVIARKDGTEERLSAATELRLATDDVIRIHTGNGAVRTNARFFLFYKWHSITPRRVQGHGDPRERPREMVMADLRDGYISVADAQSVYGQEISADVPHTPPVREAATAVATRGWLSGTNVVGGAAALMVVLRALAVLRR